MDEFTVDAFSNRSEPVPLLTVTHDDESISSSEAESTGRRARLKKKLSGQRLRDKAQDYASTHAEKIESSPGRPSIQDRLFSKLLQQVIPIEDLDDPEDELSKVDRRSSKYVKRPSFSLPLMTNNFRRFNARIGIVFVFQNRMIRLFTWHNPIHTLSFMAIFTFVCLDPYLLLALPLAVALLFIMVPAFIARHPPSPPQARASTNATGDSYAGPPIAPARTIRPAAETSKDFFRNMRDLQNSMADFSNVHDALVANIAPLTNFSDEVLSSTVFLYLFLATISLFISAHLLPLRATILLGGQGMVISGHPNAQEWLAHQSRKAQKKAAAISNGRPTTIFNVPVPNNAATRNIQSVLSSMSEITLSQAPETREVEVFELQHRPLLPPGNNKALTTEWSPHLYTSSPYDPLSPARISGSRPSGTRFFEDVVPPSGWEWASKKWELDLEAGEWVDERLIVGVEYDVVKRDREITDDDELMDSPSSITRKASINADFGGWVWDLPPLLDASNMNRDEEVWLAYGDYNLLDMDNGKKEKKKDRKRPDHKRGISNVSNKDWEESVRFDNRGRTGEWRRRRWVRVVKRKQIDRYDEI